jgi:hypothetical protein
MQIKTVEDFIKVTGLYRGKANFENTNEALKKFGIKDPEFIADIYGSLGVSMKATNTKLICQDEVSDIFEFENEYGELERIRFHWAYEMDAQDVENYLNK